MKTAFKRFQSESGHSKARKSSKGSKRYVGEWVHPYMKPSFWLNPLNHFWETSMYSEASKEYYRKQLQSI